MAKRTGRAADGNPASSLSGLVRAWASALVLDELERLEAKMAASDAQLGSELTGLRADVGALREDLLDAIKRVDTRIADLVATTPDLTDDTAAVKALRAEVATMRSTVQGVQPPPAPEP